MNPLTILNLLTSGILPRAFTVLQTIISQGVSVNSILAAIKNPDLQALFTMIGKQLFPNAIPEVQGSGAAVVLASPEYVKKFQNMANIVLSPPPSPLLEVDGHFGALSHAACERLQKQLGVPVDGFPGDKTMAAGFEALLKQTSDSKIAAQAPVAAPEVPKVAPTPLSPVPAGAIA